ncbi:TetR/AcrR family transcriptional regulator [Azospirillum thermophilum]|uniref:HTH tetR-type domain-containing protein n=1 Tax=Azospirillum thermophilum TaxID=2202148 RepID=A0A2S2CVI0_9PROT|nr:TetR/AcrR family transcriptional regulator [Azospirillum thermophilum]AWK88501.1 hypothetical protein DEW08_20795 [Azospirillum thermophilum]
MSSALTLTERHTDATQRLILSSAMDLLEHSGVPDLTVRAVAKQAGMSERTVFRYYASRDAFLDAVAAEVVRHIGTPPAPARIGDLPGYVRPLYTRFEEKSALVQSALHTELLRRVRESVAVDRWRAVRDLIDAHAPHRAERDRSIAAANIRYYLAASTWHYYRFHFAFPLDEAIACAETAVRLALEEIGRE